MKLRNKKTGKIAELGYIASSDGFIILQDVNTQDFIVKYGSLSELNTEWEDYEEPKEHYILNGIGVVRESTLHNTPKYRKEIVELIINNNKPIGNYFDTREEAEKAVEKLKAWKRLKDYNVKFYLDFVRNRIDFTYSINNTLLDVLDSEEQIFNNMKIIFGGEE